MSNLEIVWGTKIIGLLGTYLRKKLVAVSTLKLDFSYPVRLGKDRGSKHWLNFYLF